ncbi:steroid 17-alpha-hydroxylase/17,20 lyase isoform 2-T2 [Macrochelys suwanniensis]
MVPLLGALLLALALLSFWRLAKGKAEPRPKYPRSLPSLPIIGSLLHLTSNRQFHLLFHSLQKKYGSLYSLQMGSQYVVVVNHYLHAKEVLLKKGKTFAGRPHTVTTDILTRDGKDIAFATISPLWKFQRKQVHEALSVFGKGTLALEKIICREAASMCETLNSLQDDLLNITPELHCAVTNVVCSLCFGSCYRRGDPEFEAMLKYSQGIVDTVAKESLVDIFPWLQVFPNKDLALLKRSVEVRDQLLQKKFKEHKEALGSDLANDLMDALLRTQLNMENNNSRLALPLELTDDHLLMTVADIFGAGVETTSTVLKWAVLYLLHYPEVQRKIQEELDQKIGFERHPQLSDRQQLPYLEATISEVLRIRPISPLLLPHMALTDARSLPGRAGQAALLTLAQLPALRSWDPGVCGQNPGEDGALPLPGLDPAEVHPEGPPGPAAAHAGGQVRRGTPSAAVQGAGQAAGGLAGWRVELLTHHGPSQPLQGHSMGAGCTGQVSVQPQGCF